MAMMLMMATVTRCRRDQAVENVKAESGRWKADEKEEREKRGKRQEAGREAD